MDCERVISPFCSLTCRIQKKARKNTNDPKLQRIASAKNNGGRGPRERHREGTSKMASELWEESSAL